MRVRRVRGQLTTACAWCVGFETQWVGALRDLVGCVRCRQSVGCGRINVLITAAGRRAAAGAVVSMPPHRTRCIAWSCPPLPMPSLRFWR